MLPRPDQRIITSLFLGTALSIASVKIVAMVVREMGFMRRNVGMALIASAIIDDTAGWVIVAIISGLAVHGQVDTLALGQSVLGTAIFLAASFTLGRRLVFSIIRWTNDNFVSEVPVVTAILLIMGTMALTTHLIGVHTVLGAFVAGILVGESPILTRHIDEQLRGLVVALFMPIFFSLAGLHADLTHLGDSTLFFLTIGLILIASLGKFAGAFLGGALGGLSARESLALGCGMNARGSTEVIVASIGLSMGALSQDLFTMIVAMAVVTTMAMPPTLRWAFSRLPLRGDERVRLEREAFEATGFVTNIERLLVAVDDSANGKLAWHLADMLARSGGVPMTVLHLGRRESVRGIGKTLARRVEAVVSGVNKTGDTGVREARARRLDVALHVGSLAPEAVVTKEARKGYDLLVIGVESTTAAHGGFHEQIARMAAGFDGPLAVAVARGSHLQEPPQRPLNILVPVRGNKVSRRGAEVALALARGGTSAVTALYVMGTVGLGAAQRRLRRPSMSRRHEEAILKDIVELADRYDTPIRTALRLDIAPEDAILRQARLGRYDLVVMGVGRPGGETLYFGKIAAAVLENSQHSILFVSS
jgi:Kef-type K+ transport system membrane component KefB